MEELAASNLHYVGEARLAALGDDELKRLSQLMAPDDAKPGSVPVAKPDLIAFLLKCKHERAARSTSTSPLSTAKPPRADAADATDADAATDADTDGTDDSADDGGVAISPAVTPPAAKLFKTHHKIRVAAFNSLKLRLGAAGLADQWVELIKTFSKFDVLLVSEVPAEPSIAKLSDKRSYQMKHLLDLYSHETDGLGDAPVESRWEMQLSMPSGSGNAEVHAIFVKKPVEFLPRKAVTHFDAGGVTLDHAPFVVGVYDGRFEHTDDRTWMFSSVHFPPKNRKKARDSQLTAFFKEYAESSVFRANTPLSKKGAKDAMQSVVNHVVAGDFNAYVGDDKYGLEKLGFEALLGEAVSTSAGGQAYDNFVATAHTTDRFSMKATVLELLRHEPSSKNTVSDHSPILLSIEEQPRKSVRGAV